MAIRYQQNQWNKLKEQFREHPYYKLCKTVFDEFQKLCPTMVMTPEQLFVDASHTLDSIIQTGDKSAEHCHSLWTEKYKQYREQDQMTGRPEDTKAEVAMLFYMVMYGVTTVNHSHYRGSLQRMLHDCICEFYGIKECLNIEQKLHEPVNQHTDEMMAWMAEYFVSSQSLTKEIDLIFHPNKKTGGKVSKKSVEKKPSGKPLTLKYYRHGNNGVLMKQRRRVNIVFRKFCEWGWIDDRTTADDFDALFEGVPRHCNITWKANTTILTILLQKLLKQHYIAKQTRQSPSSMVKEQFGLTPNFDQSRLVDDYTFRIDATTFLLDISNPLPLRKGGGDDENDTTDAALQAVMSGQLRSTKGI